jgi:hypothetical protein
LPSEIEQPETSDPLPTTCIPEADAETAQPEEAIEPPTSDLLLEDALPTEGADTSGNMDIEPETTAMVRND